MRIRPVYTIGHSTLPLATFVALLQAHGVEVLLDVRKMPRSAANPQYNDESLAEALPRSGIRYDHDPRLAGLRKRSKDSVNGAWRNKSFQAYADYMQTPDFQKAVDELIALKDDAVVAIMCAETLPWRCHRSLIADALVARKVPAVHIMSNGKDQIHALRDFAVVRGKRVSYPSEEQRKPTKRSTVSRSWAREARPEA